MRLDERRVSPTRHPLARRSHTHDPDSEHPPQEFKWWWIVGMSPFLVHPQSLSSTADLQRYRNYNYLVEEREEPIEISVEAESTREPGEATPANEGQDKNDIAEPYLALTAKTLRRQLRESQAMYDEFKQAYEEDIESVKSYASEETCRQIWLEKFQQGHRRKNVAGSEDQFVYQHNELTESLGHLNKAVTRILKGRAPGSGPDNDERLQLERLREAGKRLDELAHQALESWDAFKDLGMALIELQKLVNHVNRRRVKALHEAGNQENERES